MGDARYVYRGVPFTNLSINPINYIPEFFNIQIALESDLFYEFRKENNILPYRINQSTKVELDKIEKYYLKNSSTFFFLFNGNEIIGSILFFKNYIQALTISKKYHRIGFGTKLTQYVINHIFNKGYETVELRVLYGNIPAHELYLKTGFERVNDS